MVSRDAQRSGCLPTIKEDSVYKLLLCWRYLRTRYLALVCIISVMLGVATLIVVNSVMSGFSTKLRTRLHGLLSDMVLEANGDGFPNAEAKMELIRSDPFLADRIVAMTPTLEVFGMIQFHYNDYPVTRAVHLIGIDPEGRAKVGGFKEHLKVHKDDPQNAFALTEDARQFYLNRNRPMRLRDNPSEPLVGPGEKPPPDPPPSVEHTPQGAIVGYAIAHYRDRSGKPDQPVKNICTLPRGEEIVLTTISGQRLAPVYDRFVVSDFFHSEMSEYDSQFVFVPLEHLQKLRTMENRVTAIQMRLRDYDQDKTAVTKRLEELFGGQGLDVVTWEKKQGPLLAAIGIEKGILNVLLFMIIAVAGFGILAIFSMIVIEKTRDIGILKALGASNVGVMKIFLGYGLLLGVVGSGLGTAIGVGFTVKINEIEQALAKVTGQEIFDRSIYYFSEIPTHIDTSMIAMVNLGAVFIAVLFSILPALRAALLHPVRALRYE